MFVIRNPVNLEKPSRRLWWPRGWRTTGCSDQEKWEIINFVHLVSAFLACHYLQSELQLNLNVKSFPLKAQHSMCLNKAVPVDQSGVFIAIFLLMTEIAVWR